MFFLEHFNYVITISIALFMFTLVGIQKIFPSWLKWVIGVYYLIPLPLLEYLQKRLADKWYATTPVPDEFWDINTRLANIFGGILFIPAVVLFAYMYFQWFKQEKRTEKRIYLAVSLVPIVLTGTSMFLFYSFVYGYQP